MTRRQSQLQNTKHEYVLDRLSSYMDGQLPADEQARVEAHLRICHSCRNDLRTLRWTHDLLQEVVPVAVPRSFVIREANLVRPRRTWFGRRPLAALQWATALVAILLVLVVAGDVWIGARPAPGGELPVISAVAMRATTDQATVTLEAEVFAPSPVQEESAAESAPVQGAPIAPEAEVSKDAEIPNRSGQAMEQSGMAADTPTGAAIAAEEAPIDKEAIATTEPMSKGETKQESESQPRLQSVATAPPPGRQPADAMPVAAPSSLNRTGWRVAKIGLSVLLAGLIIAIVWMYRRKRV